MINRKIPWTSQPQYPVDIDRSNPLGAKVVYASTLAGGYAYDSVARKLGVNTAAVAKATPRGMALNFNGSSAYITLPTTNLVSGYPLTVACWFEKTTSVSQIIYSLNGSGYSAIAGYTPANLNLSINSGSNPATLGYPFASIPAGWNHLVVVHKSGSFTMYLNGVDVTAATTGSENWGQPAAGNHSIGQRLGGASARWFNGGIQDFVVFRGALSAAEALQLYQAGYQIFQPPQRRIWVGAAGGGDVSLSITGQSLTANLGALSASVTSSVTGNQTTLQQGTITANVSQTLTGQAISLVQGSVSSDVSTVITGQTVSLAQGSVTDASSGNVTKALSGQSLSVSQGALTASISLALNGQSIVLSGGSVSPAISSALAGQQASVQQGNVSANISAGLTGQAAVISNGTVFQAGSDVTKALTGQQLSIALGVLLEKKTIARPSSDTTAGAWLPSAGSSLYATLDEVSPDDADYIYTNSVSTCKIALNAVADPLTSSGQIVSYRVWSPNSNGLTVRLMQGATEIASWTHTVLPTSPTTYQQALTAGQCDAITDYSTLAIQLESV